jgi:hypothetical protein
MKTVIIGVDFLVEGVKYNFDFTRKNKILVGESIRLFCTTTESLFKL